MKDEHLQIRDFCEVFDGPHATPTKTDEGPFYLSISSLENGTLDLNKSAHLSEQDFQKWTKRVTPRKGDLLFSYETRLGEAALMPDGIKACLGRRMGILRPETEKIISEFLLYSYLAPEFQNIITANTITGATVDRISLTDLPSFVMRVPKLDDQRSIVSVLSALDAKIELNNRINEELEGMAKLLYDYWFVQFDFPITAAQAAAMGQPKLEGKPYRASGGKMIFNEALKREIPKGWDAKSLSELAGVTKETVSPSDLPDHAFKLFSIPVFDSTGTYSLDDGAEIGSNKFVVTGKDILVSKLNPWFSRVIYAEADIDAVCSTEFVVWQTSASWLKAFLYMVATSPQFICFCTQSATGTSNSHKRVNPEVMMSHSVPWASSVVKEFGDRVNPILLARQSNQTQNKELTELRDWLLPMLMNGQVTVG